jgi:hypothetical protein
MPPALLVLATPSSCSALVTCLTEGIALLTGAIANGSLPRQERARLQSLSIGIVCACEAVVGLGPVAAETNQSISNQNFCLGVSSPTLLGIGGLLPVPINRALRRVTPPGALPSRSDRLPAAGACLEDVAVG